MPLNTSSSESGLFFAYLLDGRGGARTLSWDEVATWQVSDGVLWLHFDYSHPAARDWVLEQSGLERLVAEALIAEETRPRTTAMQDGFLMALRGVNLNPGAEPNDMVSLRLWVDKTRMISTRKRDLFSARDVVNQLNLGEGPRGAAALLVDLIDRIVLHMGDTVVDIEDMVDALEEEMLSGQDSALRSRFSGLRRQTIELRRYFSPQRDALGRLMIDKSAWLAEPDRLRLREISDRLIRHIEDLDAIRERQVLAHEELLSRMSEQLNSRMYVLSMISAIFLPLGFLTGLLGVNVGGIPGAHHPWAFSIFVLILLVIVLFVLALFRWKKWF